MDGKQRVFIITLAFLILFSLVALGYTPAHYSSLARFMVGALCTLLAYSIWFATKGKQ